MKIFDSCVWIAFLNSEDSCNELARDTLSEMEVSEICIPEMIYTETLTVLKMKKGEEACNNFLSFLRYYNFEISFLLEEEFLHSTQKFMNNKKLSFIDSFLYALSDKYEIITFDKALKKLL